MASRRKTKVEDKEIMDELAEKVADQMTEAVETVETVETVENTEEVTENPVVIETVDENPEEKQEETVKMPEPIEEKPVEPAKPAPKYKVGSVVFVSKEAQADLNGFKLFPPYKKYTYTVEAYNGDTGVYSLRRLNLSLKLKESDIVAPHEKSGDSLTRRQF